MKSFGNESIKILRYWRTTLADHEHRSVKRHDDLPVTMADITMGSLPRSVGAALFERWERRTRGSKRGNPDQTIPIVVGLINLREVRHSGTRLHTVVWLPATLDRESYIHPTRDRLPWISRDALEPTAKDSSGPVVASVEDYDDFLRENRREPHDWADVFEYVTRLVGKVLRQPFDGFSFFGFETEDPFVQIYPENIPYSGSIIKLYDSVLTRTDPARTSSLWALWGDLEAPSMRLEIDERRHVGQMEGRYALGPSQRAALHAVVNTKPGQILAVNGPPGTGKTTLVQSILATSVVERALIPNGSPAVLLACSTNNQAITNIQDVLAKVEVPVGHPLHASILVKRWLPEVVSYGLYLPASSKSRSVDIVKHPSFSRMVDRHNWEGVAAKMEDRAYVEQATAYYVTCADQYGRARPLAQHVRALQDELVRAKTQFDDLMSAYERILAARAAVGEEEIVERDRRASVIESTIASKAARVDTLRALQRDAVEKGNRLRTIVSQLRECFEPSGLVERTFGWLPSVAAAPWQRVLARARALGVRIPAAFSQRTPSRTEVDHWFIHAFSPDFTTTTTRSLESEIALLQAQMASAAKEKGQIGSQYRELEAATTTWRAQTAHFYAIVHPCAPAGSNPYDNPKVMLEDVDMCWRVYMFHLASRYWEGRWLLEMERIVDDHAVLRGTGLSQTQARYRRFAMVTPLMISTFYKAPAYFSHGTHQEPLVDFVDLLLVDEAGQVPPDVGVPTFALARRAVVIGDVDQIEPIPNAYPSVDAMMLSDNRLPVDLMETMGYSCATGSIMAMARSVSVYSSATCKGMQLVEHRRSFDKIANFSNELVYHGILVPLRGEPAPGLYPLPQLGYAHVLGVSKSLGGSVRNVHEATLIAEWLGRRMPGLLAHYAKLGRPLGMTDLVAIITPFRAQVMEIRKQLEIYVASTKRVRAGGKTTTQASIADIEVGTVHAFQGAERPIVLFSPVYTLRDAPFKFINARPNFLNVTASRAQDSFIVFGDTRILEVAGNTSVLGKHVFADVGNAILDVVPLHHFPDEGTSTIETLVAHQNLMVEALQQAKQRLLLVGSFVRPRAGAGSLLYRLTELTKRGVEVVVVCDRPSWNRADRAAHQVFEQAGVVVRVVQALHGNVLTYDDACIAEGGFNWLSLDAPEPPSRRNIVTAVYRGSLCKSFVAEAWQTVGVSLHNHGRAGDLATC